MATAHDRLMTDEDFERLALAEPHAGWELWRGRPCRKPGMTFEHSDIAEYLSHLLQSQLARSDWRVRSNKGHVRRPTRSYYIPDLFVIPEALFRSRRGQPRRLESYTEPLPLVVEVWSRSTGGYDVDEKLEEYQRRGDAEIWYIHPSQGGESEGTPPSSKRTLTAWRLQPDHSYTETVYCGGAIQPVALPGVTIDLDTLFD